MQIHLASSGESYAYWLLLRFRFKLRRRTPRGRLVDHHAQGHKLLQIYLGGSENKESGESRWRPS